MASHHPLHRGARVTSVLAAVLALAAAAAVFAVQVAAAGEPPCPSCPSKLPPVGGGSGGSGSTGTGGAQPVAPLISLGPVSVQDGLASVTGMVNAAVSARTGIHVTVDAAPVSLSVNGAFSATVNVSASAAIVVKASDGSTGQQSVISIPVSAVPANGVAADALAQLNADAVTLMLPPDGFTIVDGVAIDARVHVKAIAGISSLTLNGVNLLAKLRIGGSSGSGSSAGSGSGSTNPGTPPGATTPPAGTSAPACHHSATAKVAGSSRTVKVSVTATNGASQTSTIRVKRIRSVIRFGRAFSVSAFGASGIRITAVRFDISRVATTHRVVVNVTVRDRRQYLVRDAVVMLQPTAHGGTIRGSTAELSNMAGRARFSVLVPQGASGHRLSLTVLARTPRATARVTRSVQIH